jgi:quinoprotein glucose dehydrogenase
VTDRTEQARSYILQRLSRAAFGWFRPFEEGRPNVLYGLHGGSVWPGAAFDPETGFLYITANKMPWIITLFRIEEAIRDPKAPPSAGEKVYMQNCASCHGADRRGGLLGEATPLQGLRHYTTDAEVLRIVETGDPLMPALKLTTQEQKDLLDFLFLRTPSGPIDDRALKTVQYTYNGYPRLLDQEGYPGCKPPWGTLVCMNLNTGKIQWKSVLGEYAELTARGIPKTGTTNLGGAIVTAGGLVFAGGTRDNKIRAFDKTTGRQLWEHPLPYGGYAPPATYEVKGRQFVVIAATGGGFPGSNEIAGPKEKGDAYVAFALPEGDARQ